ncbi:MULTISPECIES: nicotinate phosphoribosyltransferase [Methanobrevibacter]|uniref:Nicotinamide phosphoribosyltransferase n=1 Tax=Methanobrevibacter gottschalkii DSM 11977 TaxID=1122229 RepID=A0A3N5B043_9EURY|nr:MULTISPECIES: nicotinate phosphoribosyltransferase [Methanobrevibacter]OEC95146.1 nicotinate phosphoribosyltransferase [Methanobrevibacter sp. A27]RPF50936.1 nicotinamide phosphoribosyltransferase [Methanobrevibacter gottschalkii DSM 11977]
MIENNICLLTDSYKVTHHYFYPKGTEKIYSYLESRLGSEFNKTIFYGLQYIIKKYLEGSVVNQQKIEEADKLISNHIGEDIFNKDGWYYILDNYDGYLPIEIKAVPEGTPVNVSNVLMSVENTDKKSFWLVNYLESLLLQVWYPSTVATLSAEVRKLSKFYLEVTGSSKDNLDFMLHDFGYRGASSTESSMLAGSAHLLSFSGTDTIPALLIPKNYYNDSNLYGFSVQATEHSVMTSLGPKGEFDQILNVIDNAKNGILSMVIDSYDYKNFLTEAGKSDSQLNKAINDFLAVEGNKVVFRPDSGEPVSTTIDCLNILGKGFGSYLTDKGYKVFDSNIGLLWGDGLDYHKIRDILFAMKSNGWAAENIIFGMGGGLHTYVNRDTQRNAFKCSAQLRDGKWFDIYKNPLDSSKKSKTGRFKLINENNSFKTISIDGYGDDCLRTVFKNGKLLIEDTFADIKSKTLNYSNFL